MAVEKVVNITVNNNIDETTTDINQLNSALSTTEKEQQKITSTTKAHGEALSRIAPQAKTAVEGFLSMGKAMWALVANPLGAVLAAIVAAVGLLFLAFKSFQPLVDKVEQSFAALSAVMDVIKNTFIAVVTGTKSLGEAFNGLSGDMEDAAKRAMALKKAQQDLEDTMKSQEVQTAKNRAEINKLNVQLRNRTLSEEERLKIADKIVQKENADFLQRKKLVDEEVRQAREAIAIKAQFTKAEIKLLKETGDATKELAESRGGNYDEEYDALNAARQKAIALEDESTQNLEKAYNRRDKLEDDKKAKEEARAAKREVERQKEIQALERKKKLEEENLKALNDFKIAQNNAAFAQRELEIQQEQEKIDELNKFADKFAADEEARRLKDLEDTKKIAEAKKNIQQATIDTISGGVNLLKQIAGKNKALQIAAIVADSAIGIQKIITNTQAANAADAAWAATLGPAGVAYSAGKKTLNTVNAGIGIASNLLATKTAISALGGGGSPSAPSTGGGSSGGTTAPQFNVVGQSGTNQLAQSIGKQQNQPIKAYVVSGDVSTAQQLDRNAIQTASFP